MILFESCPEIYGPDYFQDSVRFEVQVEGDQIGLG